MILSDFTTYIRNIRTVVCLLVTIIPVGEFLLVLVLIHCFHDYMMVLN